VHVTETPPSSLKWSFNCTSSLSSPSSSDASSYATPGCRSYGALPGCRSRSPGAGAALEGSLTTAGAARAGGAAGAHPAAASVVARADGGAALLV